MFSLAPKRSSIGSLKTWKSTVTTREMTTSRAVQPPRMALAPSWSPAPMRMAALEPPPMPARAERAEMNMMTGKATPRPVRARSPVPSIWPMYIRSTML